MVLHQSVLRGLFEKKKRHLLYQIVQPMKTQNTSFRHQQPVAERIIDFGNIHERNRARHFWFSVFRQVLHLTLLVGSVDRWDPV